MVIRSLDEIREMAIGAWPRGTALIGNGGAFALTEGASLLLGKPLHPRVIDSLIYMSANLHSPGPGTALFLTSF
jgi:hypothetical protein